MCIYVYMHHFKMNKQLSFNPQTHQIPNCLYILKNIKQKTICTTYHAFKSPCLMVKPTISTPPSSPWHPHLGADVPGIAGRQWPWRCRSRSSALGRVVANCLEIVEFTYEHLSGRIQPIFGILLRTRILSK